MLSLENSKLFVKFGRSNIKKVVREKLKENSSYQSISVKFIEHPQCFAFWIIIWFYAILRVFVLYSHYGDSSSNDKLNGNQAFESLGLLEALTFQATHFMTVIITIK